MFRKWYGGYGLDSLGAVSDPVNTVLNLLVPLPSELLSDS